MPLGCVISTTFAGPLSVSVNSRVSTMPFSCEEDSGVLIERRGLGLAGDKRQTALVAHRQLAQLRVAVGGIDPEWSLAGHVDDGMIEQSHAWQIGGHIHARLPTSSSATYAGMPAARSIATSSVALSLQSPYPFASVSAGS